ncbi:MAG: SDR family oxidoreductase [Dehalococcoidia bacterium]
MATNLFDFTGKVAIITGASSGLGVTFAEALAEAGADLTICARRLNRLEETAEKIIALGRRCLVVQTDVTQADQVENMVSKTVQEYGKIDILVNNAGASYPGAKLAEEVDFDAYRQVMEANLTSAALCSHRVGREMLARGYGRIINIASILGVVGGIPEDQSFAYSISKHGMVGLTRACALQWAQRGITVNAIGPAYFPSEMTDTHADTWGPIARHTPLGRLGRPEELKTAVLFLAAEASSYVTGQTICIDGGWTAW